MDTAPHDDRTPGPGDGWSEDMELAPVHPGDGQGEGDDGAGAVDGAVDGATGGVTDTVDGAVGAVGTGRIHGEGCREPVEALAEADLDACNEVRGVDCAVGDPVVDVEVRADVGGPEA